MDLITSNHIRNSYIRMYTNVTIRTHSRLNIMYIFSLGSNQWPGYTYSRERRYITMRPIIAVWLIYLIGYVTGLVVNSTTALVAFLLGFIGFIIAYIIHRWGNE